MPARNSVATSCESRLRALVLDGDPEYADVFVSVLAFVGDGPETWATTSATEARRRVARVPYDVIVADRESGGEHLLLELRRHQPDAVLVVTSASPLTVSETTRQFEVGADEIVEKPFHPSIMAARINRILTVRSKMQRAPRTRQRDLIDALRR